jgi:hypothetical protein
MVLHISEIMRRLFLKLILDLNANQEQVFDLQNDPKEKNLLSGHEAKIDSERLKSMFKENNLQLTPMAIPLYHQNLQVDNSENQIDSEEYKQSLDRLKALGYL